VSGRWPRRAGRAAALPAQSFSLTEQALLLEAAERHLREDAQGRAASCLEGWATSHAVHRRRVEVRVQHAAGQVDAAWALADALAKDWLGPASAGRGEPEPRQERSAGAARVVRPEEHRPRRRGHSRASA